MIAADDWWWGMDSAAQIASNGSGRGRAICQQPKEGKPLSPDIPIGTLPVHYGVPNWIRAYWPPQPSTTPFPWLALPPITSHPTPDPNSREPNFLWSLPQPGLVRVGMKTNYWHNTPLQPKKPGIVNRMYLKTNYWPRPG